MILPARESLERHFASNPDRPFTLNAATEVESTPRMVDMVARGFSPAMVSRFRLAFLPSGMIVRPLVDGPEPLTTSVYTRRNVALEGVALTLVDRARARFEKLVTPSLHGLRVRLAPAWKR